MSQEQLVVNGALVCCTMTEKPSKDKLGDTENYKIYRIVHLGDTNNGAFGLDEAFLTEYDAGAELYIEPFPVCRSPYYARALQDIASYLQGLKRASTDAGEQSRIEDRCQLLRQLAQAAVEREQIVRGDWRGQCVMELLDQWFNCSSTLAIDDFMQCLERLKGELDGICGELDDLAAQVLRAAREAMGEELERAEMMLLKGELSLIREPDPLELVSTIRGIQEIEGEDGEKDKDKMYSWRYLSGQEEKGGLAEELTEEEARSLLDGYQKIRDVLSQRYTWGKELRKRLYAVTLRYTLGVREMGGGSSYVDAGKYVDGEGDELVKEVEDVWRWIQEEVQELDKADIWSIIEKYDLTVPYQAYRDYMGDLYDKIHDLYQLASTVKISSDAPALVTTASYLMCRCGGRIEILSSGQWVEEVDSKVDEHIVEILRFAEKDIYGLMQTYGAYADTPDTEDYANTRYSTLIALNGIHVILESMGVEGVYKDIKDLEEVRRKYPLPNISIDLVPQNEVEATKARQAIAREAADSLPFGLNWIFKVLFFMVDMSNRFENEGDNVKKVAEGEVEAATEGWIKEEDWDKMVKWGDAGLETWDALSKGADVVDDALKDIAEEELPKEIAFLKNTAGKVKKINDNGFLKGINAVGSAVTWCRLLQDLMTRSYALFVGKITIEVNTGWDKYTYEANYDGEGALIGNILYRKSYLGRDMFTNLGTAHFYDNGSPYMFGIYEGDGEK